tara:strand:- start:24263 stop:24784 length:522 start_codon:yes stop_codon:yes gene_type:complete
MDYLKSCTMGSIKKLVFLILIAGSLSFCASKQTYQINFPQEIAAVYFQKVNNGEGQVASRTDFYIEFERPLAKGIVLDKVYFQNQIGVVEIERDNTFVAHFYKDSTVHDLVLHSDPTKEYGNKAPIITEFRFDLQPTEAVLEYRKREKTFFYKILSIKERPMILNPSGIKPKK